jgi:ABC-type transport system substrate-binding protein
VKKGITLVVALSVALLLASVYTVFPVHAPARSDVDILFYGSQEVAYSALKAGEIDFLQWTLTHEQKMDAEADSNLCVSAYIENGMVEFDFNNNYTVAKYPGVRNPLNVKEVRQALSCAVDKQYIVASILEGAGAVLNVPIPPNSKSWWPTCAALDNYPWKYNMTKAEELLAIAGFIDTDADGVRNYPADWPGRPGQPNMDALTFYERTDREDLYKAGRCFYDQLTTLGIPCNMKTWNPFWPCPVMATRNYHIYTGAWNLGRYPTGLYPLFHSDYWFPDGSNYVTGMNASNLPNYPQLDELVYAVYFPSNLSAAKDAALAAAELGWCELVVNIPLWSYTSYVGWRKTLLGVINMNNVGIENYYTLLNAFSALDGPIRMGTVNAPKSANPLYAMWYFDYAVMDRVFNRLLNVNPYDLTVDTPGAAQDWEVGTWVDPNPGPGEPSTKSTVTYYLRDDVGFANATNGAPMGNLTAYDLEFSCWYTYAFDDAWNWASYMDVHHSEVIDARTIKYYFDDDRYWYYTAPQYPILCRDELLNPLCGTSSVSFASDGTNCSAGTQFKLPTSEQIIQVTSDDLPVDYVIFAGYEDYEHNWIWLQGDLPAGTYTINYYTPDVDPHGYYLANLPWQETWYSFGPFYLMEIVPGVGGHANLKTNLYYWLETPPLGETDWRWWWDTPGRVPGWEVPGRDSGYYEINIYDVVKAAASYCHRGDGTYDPDYFPGADLDASDLGHVGIYDIVTIAGKYGLKWGQPPP